jgi:hypothetical protein
MSCDYKRLREQLLGLMWVSANVRFKYWKQELEGAMVWTLESTDSFLLPLAHDGVESESMESVIDDVKSIHPLTS